MHTQSSDGEGTYRGAVQAVVYAYIPYVRDKRTVRTFAAGINFFASVQEDVSLDLSCNVHEKMFIQVLSRDYSMIIS